MKTNQIVFLGPTGATFSYEAYLQLSKVFNTPKAEDATSVLVPVSSNSAVLKTLSSNNNAYGVIAMETKAEGKVIEPVESFVQFLNGDCPISIIGAIKMELNFVLMARSGTKIEKVKTVLGHKKALGACAKRLDSLQMKGVEKDSNGQAAEEVARIDAYSDCAALGPVSAAKKYSLSILSNCFEDEKAVTTFFLLGPADAVPGVRKNNRVLIVNRIKHESGSLVDTLIPFKQAEISLIHIHSVYISNNEYVFVMEMEVNDKQINIFKKATTELKKHVVKSLIFGPFGVETILAP